MKIAFALAALASSGALLTGQEAAGSLDAERFAALRRQLAPDPEARWRQIPWRIDLLEAQRQAAGLRRPLFLWAMDGHPLGCT